jgi:hypothetical protein
LHQLLIPVFLQLNFLPMKMFLLSVTLLAASLATSAQNDAKVSTPDPTKKIEVVEASCGQCNFGMKERRGCDLAVRINGKSYFVEGTKIDEHGDAHAEDGFCEKVRKAEVQGEIKENKYKVTYFKLLPLKTN